MPKYYSQFLNRPNLVKLTFSAPDGSEFKAFFWQLGNSLALLERSVPLPAVKRIWICQGGNANLALDWMHFIDDYQRYLSSAGSGENDSEIGFLLLDYPGYGLNPGQPSPRSILDIATLAVEQIISQRRVPISDADFRIGLLGHSLGCAASLQVA